MTEASYKGVVVVVPTRNRAGIAKSAVRSVLSQADDDVRVMVSDNSTREEEARELEAHCRALSDERVRYVRPPSPLPMSGHWDWAIREALGAYDANHFTYLTDRMMFKDGELNRILSFAAAHPDRIISYHHDRVVDDVRPIRVERHPYTGRLMEISCSRLARLYSEALLHPCIPRMLNCVAPRAALGRIAARFGGVFGSIAPDYNFGFRCLAVLDSFLFYDCSAIFHYALDRSNGASASRGDLTADSADFAANLPVPNANRNYATPVPDIITNGNAIFNEYLIVKAETKSPNFPALDREKYLAYLGAEANEVTEPAAQARMRARLTEAGWVAPADAPLSSAATTDARPPARDLPTLARKMLSPQALSLSLRWRASELQRRASGLRAALAGARYQPAWLFMARHLGVRPPDKQQFEFDSVEEACDFLRRFPRRPLREWPEQEEMIAPK